jgi:hypothetical protein
MRSNNGCFNENTNVAVSDGEKPWRARARHVGEEVAHRAPSGPGHVVRAVGLQRRPQEVEEPPRLGLELVVADEVAAHGHRRELLPHPFRQQRLAALSHDVDKTVGRHRLLVQ